MNLLSEKELTDEVLRMPIGRQTFFTTGIAVKAISEKFLNIDFRQNDLNEFTIIKSEASNMSAKREIEIACAKCDESHVITNHDVKYVRVIVSQFNRMHNCKVSVRQVGNGVILVADPSSKPWLRQTEYEAIKLDMEAKLRELRRKVRPNEFFDMLSPEFKNGVPDDVLNDTVEQPSYEHEEEYDEEGLTPDPSIFVTRPHYDPLPEIEAPQNWRLLDCTSCGEEFTTLNKDQMWCDNCHVDEEDIV